MDFQSYVLSVAMVSTNFSIVLPTFLIIIVSLDTFRVMHQYFLIEALLDNKAVGIMKAGHCFTIEPMICEGGWRDEIW